MNGRQHERKRQQVQLDKLTGNRWRQLAFRSLLRGTAQRKRRLKKEAEAGSPKCGIFLP